ncbi:MAG: formyltransferase family protein [Nanoarchaeota archaeon]|nr:formyltransferase family protein [Nanoarchaeota archaeon]
MKIGIFGYNFPHKKTQEGLLALLLHNIPVRCIFAADAVELPFYQSKIRVAPKRLIYTHPREIAKRFQIPYYVVVHNSRECEKLIKECQLDLGIILGARILKEDIIKAFNIGILNMHPGMLPENRGLDNLKWAILKEYTQGVSVHLIDRAVDRGKIIVEQPIEVYEDDTLLDIFLRLQNLEQVLMIEAINILKSGKREFKVVPEGSYRKAVPPEEEALLMEKFEKYKRGYKNLQRL